MGLTMDPNVRIESVAAPIAGSIPRRSRFGRPHIPFRHPRSGPAQEELELTLSGHLVELRNRLFKAALSLVPGSIIGFILSGRIIHILRAPLPTDKPLVALGLTEPFMIQMQVALVVGIILAMPVILYQFWAYVSPGLTPTERSAARPWVPLSMFFFALGVCVAYFILPFAAGFLYNYQTSDITLTLTAESYFSFITTLFLAFGLVMEFPIFLVLLSKVGIISSKKLERYRRQAILGMVVFSTVVTPGADFVSPIVMSVVMVVLYEVSIVMIRLGGR
ncbi:MAG TPA: twin-arginine translocase subunit TatC [Candidatus Limnocylindrales bacterium]